MPLSLSALCRAQQHLEQWRSIVAHKAWAKTEDCCWWYAERASVSQLAGAPWKEGWAIQEYAGTRGAEGRARIDLAVEVPAYGLRSVVEAQQIWPWLGSSHAFEEIEQGLREATGQLMGPERQASRATTSTITSR